MNIEDSHDYEQIKQAQGAALLGMNDDDRESVAYHAGEADAYGRQLAAFRAMAEERRHLFAYLDREIASAAKRLAEAERNRRSETIRERERLETLRDVYGQADLDNDHERDGESGEEAS